VKRSTDRILTTHTGSIARPDELLELMRRKQTGEGFDEDAFQARVREAVRDCVRAQVDAGLDVVNDGEQGKSGFTSYVYERLTGFESRPRPDGGPASRWKEVSEFPEYYERYFRANMFGAMLAPPDEPVCTGPIRYIGHEAIRRDIDTLQAALAGQQYVEAFLPAPLPTSLARQRNEYYRTEEEMLAALAEAVHEEYRAIIDAGFLIQLDDPTAVTLWGYADLDDAERAKKVDQMVELINYSLEGIPAERIRYHTCYGINNGPHIHDLHLRDFVEPMLRVNAQAISFEVMNLRHLHDYHAFEDVKLPDGKIIIPGMLSNGANWVEHPELIAELTVNYAKLVGRENVMIGNDCGFASQAASREIDPKVGWAKFAALARGAALASERLW
jgi:5-methyltetrahydropteroyltriglutamate--homocysteine methyltransferase